MKNKDKLFEHFIDIKNIMNIKVMKCFRALFNIERIKNNLGNYILLSIIFINTCLFFAFLIKGFNIFHIFVKKMTQTVETHNENIKINNTKKITNIKPKIKKNKNNIKDIKFKGKNIKIINYFNINKINKNNKSIKIKNKSNKKNNSPPKKNAVKEQKKDLKKK